MPDVFISHSSKDAELADRLCAILEENGLECWMAPRNIMPGDDWAGAITKAIKSSKAFLIIYSENSVNSTQVPKEIMLAGGNGSYIIPYRIDDTPLKENYEYHLGTSHWIQADIEKGIFKGEELVEAVNRGIGQTTVNVHISVENTAPIHIVTNKKPNKALPWLLGIGAFLLLALIVTIILLVVFSNDGEANTGKNGSDSGGKVTQGITDEDSSKPADSENEENNEPEYVSAPQDVDAYDFKNVDIYNDEIGEFSASGTKQNYGYVMMKFDSFMAMNVSDYDSISFSVGLVDETGEENQLKFFLDGEETGYYTAYPDKVNSGLEIDLKDVDVLRFQVDGNGALGDVAVFDITFEKSQAQEEENPDEVVEGVLNSPADYEPFSCYMTDVYKDGRADFYDENGNGFSVRGVKHDDGYVFNNMGSHLLFNTEGITEMKFSAGRLDGSYDEDNKLFIYVDGFEHDWYSVSKDGIVKDIIIELDGGLHIVDIFTEGNGSSSQVCIFDMTVTKTGEPEPTVIPDSATVSPGNIKPYFSTRTTVYNEKSTAFEVAGIGISDGYVFECYEAGMLFNVYGFNSVTMTVGVCDDGQDYPERKVYFYVDGYEVDCVTIEHNAPPKQVKIDLHGNAKTLYIYAEGNVNTPALGFYDMYFEGQKQSMSNVDIPENAVIAPDDIKPEIAGEITDYNGKGDYFYVSGESIEVGYFASEYYTSEISFDCSGYNTLHFNVGTANLADDYMLRFRKFTIYVDGQEVDTYNIGTAAGIQSIEVDVSGAEKVEIKTEDGNVEKAALGFFNMYFV